MPWARAGDTSATYPPALRVAGLTGIGADHRSVNEVFGFMLRLATQSAAHMTDYLVDAGTVAMIGGGNSEQLLKLCLKVGLLTRIRVDGETRYKVIEDPEFIHVRLKAEVEWERQQRADTSDQRLAVPVRARDGDLCRYCGLMVQWRGRTSPRKGTLDHLEPGQPATVNTMVVACKSCNSELRDQSGLERATLTPPPASPYYSEHTADWLTKNGRPSAATPRPDIQPATAAPQHHAEARTPAQLPAATPQPVGHRAEAASDPTPVGPRADNAHNGDPPIPNAFQVTEGMHSAGSGRDGLGSVRGLPVTPPIRSNRARKRSRRGGSP